MKASLKNQIELMAQRNGSRAKPPGKHQTGKINVTETTTSVAIIVLYFSGTKELAFWGHALWIVFLCNHMDLHDNF